MSDRYDNLKAVWMTGHRLSDDEITDLIWWADGYRAERDTAQAKLALVGQAKSALTHLGQAWRGDWSEFDGRTLRAQLDDLSLILDGKRTLAQFLAGCGICPDHSCWPEHCRDQH